MSRGRGLGRRPGRRSALGLLGLIAAALGCDRSSSGQCGAAAAPSPSATAPASRGASTLRDWPAQPIDSDPADAAEGNRPLRIVSGAPSVTEIVCALGRRDALVGRTRYCDYPPGLDSVPQIGALLDVQVERLLELRPDLVIIAGNSRLMADRLSPLGLRVESAPDASVEDVLAAVQRVGQLIGRPHAAQRLSAALRADLDQVVGRGSRGPRRRVLIVPGTLASPPTPPFVAGPGSFYDDLLRRAGHENAAPPGASPFGMLGIEALLRADPDVIIELDPDGATRKNGDADARAAWGALGSLAAVRGRRVHVLTGQLFYIPGPRLALLCAQLTSAVESGEHE